MNDLISRQAAIDALNEVSEHYTDKGREWHPHVNFMVEAIENLPSAQPEIVRCRECKWWEKQEDSTLGYCNAAKHCYYSLNWEVQIYRRHRADFFCADGERRSENERPN